MKKLEFAFLDEVVSETVITGSCQETPEQESKRIKAGLPAPTYSYTAVKVRRKVILDWKDIIDG